MYSVQFAIDNSIININLLKENITKPDEFKKAFDKKEKIALEEKISKKPRIIKSKVNI